MNVLEKNRRGRFRRISTTLFGTVATNQVELVSVILFQFPLSYLFHGQNDLGLALLRAARYFRILLIKPR